MCLQCEDEKQTSKKREEEEARRVSEEWLSMEKQWLEREQMELEQARDLALQDQEGGDLGGGQQGLVQLAREQEEVQEEEVGEVDGQLLLGEIDHSRLEKEGQGEQMEGDSEHSGPSLYECSESPPRKKTRRGKNRGRALVRERWQEQWQKRQEEQMLSELRAWLVRLGFEKELLAGWMADPIFPESKGQPVVPRFLSPTGEVHLGYDTIATALLKVRGNACHAVFLSISLWVYAVQKTC